jgi:hypothetical protein
LNIPHLKNRFADLLDCDHRCAEVLIACLSQANLAIICFGHFVKTGRNTGAARSPARCGLRHDIPCLTGICREIMQNMVLPAFRLACKVAVIHMFDKKIP